MDIVSHGEEAYPTGEGTILVEPIGTTVAGRRGPSARWRRATST